MIAVLMLLGSTLLIACAWLISSKLNGRQFVPVPLLDCIWLHAVVTWPTIIKGAFGSFIFGTNADTLTSFSLVLYGPAALASFIVILSKWHKGAFLFPPGVILIAMLAWVMPHVLMSNFGTSAFLPMVLALAVLFRDIKHTPVDSWCRQTLLSVLLIVMSVTVTAIISKDNVIGECRDDKCPIAGEVLWSPITNNGNFVGLAVTILLPWAIARLQFAALMPAVIGVLGFVELSGSRSAMATTVAILIVVGVARTFTRGRVVAAHALLWIGIAASTVTAVFPFERQFATYRGGLWDRAREMIESHPIAGSGPYSWVRLPAESRFFANYSPHNIWLDLAISGGILSVVVAVIGAGILLRSINKRDRDVFLLALGALVFVGILESPVQPFKLGIVPFAHLLPLYVGASSSIFISRVRQHNVESKHSVRVARGHDAISAGRGS